VVGIVIAGILSGILIWIVAKLNLGLEVDGFLSAFVAGVVIAILGGLINWGLTALNLGIPAGLLGALIHLVVAALVIYFAGSMLKGLRVNGFVGALVAAIAIAVVGWLVLLVVGAILPG
jgi:putative membrane protein